MTVSVQEQIPAWYLTRYGRFPHKVDVDSAYDWVGRALRSTRRSVEREFEGRGYTVAIADLSWPGWNGGRGVRLRARLSLRSKELLLDPRAENEMFEELVSLGFPTTPSPREVILAHELFHLFCPKCPSELAELAAHLYATEVLELPYFPGLLDIADRFASDLRTA